MDVPPFDRQFSFSHVYPSLNISAKLKTVAEDFIVEEQVSVEHSGEGEHDWIYVKKTSCNTDWVAQQLAAFCDVSHKHVSFAGLKDRHAVTTQWFSIQLPGRSSPDWDEFETFFASRASGGGEAIESAQVLHSCRHTKKLQRGALLGNSFTLRLRELSDVSDKAFDRLSERCELIAARGVPNYFGPQRFGRALNNLDQAARHFANPRRRLSRAKRSIYLSAVRSWLFNHILSERIDRDCWDKAVSGDVFMLEGKSACFRDDEDAAIQQRLLDNEIHPTAVLWGDGEPMARAEAERLEKAVIDEFPLFRDGLVAARVQAQRRACRVVPRQMQCWREGSDLMVSFSLPAGSYATVVLGEIFSDLL